MPMKKKMLLFVPQEWQTIHLSMRAFPFDHLLSRIDFFAKMP